VVELSVDTERQGEAVAAAVRVFTEYGGFVRSIIRLWVRDVCRREDMFQELFLRLVEQPVPSGAQNVRGYLYRAILRDAVDLTREEVTEKRHLKEYAERNRISIHNSLSRRALLEEGSIFGCLIRQLRQREAQVLTLRYRDDYSIPEIAAEIGIDRYSVSRYLTSGLRELKRKLAVE
jgi:RNA polymerase sigma factor (sigma-70 family)